MSVSPAKQWNILSRQQKLQLSILHQSNNKGSSFQIHARWGLLFGLLILIAQCKFGLLLRCNRCLNLCCMQLLTCTLLKASIQSKVALVPMIIQLRATRRLAKKKLSTATAFQYSQNTSKQENSNWSRDIHEVICNVSHAWI